MREQRVKYWINQEKDFCINKSAPANSFLYNQDDVLITIIIS